MTALLPEGLVVPLTFCDSISWPAGRAAPSLGYVDATYQPAAGARAQRVLDGRTVLTPAIDLKAYRCRAAIDWIEVWLHTDGRHQAVNVHRKISKMLTQAGSQASVFVSGPSRTRGYIGSSFILKFQDPDPSTLTQVLQQALAAYVDRPGPVSALPLAGIEVSIDFYVKEDGLLDQPDLDLRRWQMVEVLRRHLRPDRLLTEVDRCHPRFFGSLTSSEGSTPFVQIHPVEQAIPLWTQARPLGLTREQLAPLRLRSHTQPPVDRTSYIGAREAPIMLRLVDKVTDQRHPDEKTVQVLPPEQKRARIEVTLKGDQGELGGHNAVGLGTMGQLYGFKFKILRTMIFEFYQPTIGDGADLTRIGVSDTVNEWAVFSRSGVYGLDRLHRSVAEVSRARFKRGDITEQPPKLGKKGRLVSYVALNQTIDRALKRLSGDWQDP